MRVNQTELEKVLLAEAPKQWSRFQARRTKIERGKPKWQRDVDQAIQNAEELRRQYNPELMRIQANYDRKNPIVGLNICPKCGEPFQGNVMNGKPFCFKCNNRKPSLNLKSDLVTLNPGLYPMEGMK